MLGERLVKLRKESKLTQQQVADKLHLSRGTYAQYEIDRRVPEYATLEKMANFFEVSIDYLTGRSNSKGSEKDPVEDLIEFLSNPDTTINGEPLPKELRDDLLGYVRIFQAKGKQRDRKDT